MKAEPWLLEVRSHGRSSWPARLLYPWQIKASRMPGCKKQAFSGPNSRMGYSALEGPTQAPLWVLIWKYEAYQPVLAGANKVLSNPGTATYEGPWLLQVGGMSDPFCRK